MIKIVFYKDSSDHFIGFKSVGHAGAGEYGEDVVCAAISVLIINTMNAIERFTDDKADCKMNAKQSGYLCYRLKGNGSDDTQLLLKSLLLGIKGVMSENRKYIKLKIKEV